MLIFGVRWNERKKGQKIKKKQRVWIHLSFMNEEPPMDTLKKICFPFEWPVSLAAVRTDRNCQPGKITNRQSIRRRRNNNNRRVLDDAVIKIKLIGLVVCAFPYGNFRRRWLYSRRGVLCVIAYNALFILHPPSTAPFRIRIYAAIRFFSPLSSSWIFSNKIGIRPVRWF